MRVRLDNRRSGFSLIETLVAVSITACLAAICFHLFHQNERIFRDHSLILEMQQTARVVVSQVADDIRLAGQGLPYDVPEVILPGSGRARLNIRTSTSAVESVVLSPPSTPVDSLVPLTLPVDSTAGLFSGRQAYLWNDEGWARSTIDAVSGSARTIRLTPTSVSRIPLHFTTAPAISPDEAAAIYWEPVAMTIRRTTSTNTEDPSSPLWGPANELATNVTDLSYLYFDSENTEVVPATAELRARIVAVEVRVTVRTTAAVSDGTRRFFSLSRRNVIRSRLGQVISGPSE
jgi:prepilin-type N-terminal cleavage/methylation domain-containing protein